MNQASSAAAPAARPATSARLDRLRAQPRQPGEASFFWYETRLQREAVKVLPGEYFVHDDDLLITTTLGSCIAVCLWDRAARVGGMNHFMLPGGTGECGRYGAYAMELLIDAMMKLGSARTALEAKVFGGAQVVAGMTSINIGERNAEFVFDYLRTERIAVVSKDVLDVYPRRVCFLPASGKAIVKRLAPAQAAEVMAAEADAAPVAAAGSVELF